MAFVKSCARWSVALGLGCQLGAAAWAQNYPSKIIRFMVPGSAGSGQDVLGRLIASGLSQTLGQQVIIENRAGAAGHIGAEIVAKTPADGYTMLVINIAHALYAATSRNPTYDLLRDFAPVTQLVGSPNVLVVHPSLPVKSVGEIIKLAKARPGAINYGSAGQGSSTFIAGELFKALTAIDMVHVPYNGGGPAITAVVAGEVSVYFAPFATSLPFIRQGRVRALAVTTAQRMALTPELPTIADLGVSGYEFSNWYGLLAPARTPREPIVTMRNAVASVLGKPETRKSISDFGGIPVGSQPDEFAAYIKSQMAILAKLFEQNKLATD